MGATNPSLAVNSRCDLPHCFYESAHSALQRADPASQEQSEKSSGAAKEFKKLCAKAEDLSAWVSGECGVGNLG